MSVYAQEGRYVHTVFAQCLLQGRNADAFIADPPLIAPLQEALDHARWIIDGRPVLIEQRLPPLPDMPDVWGTADVAVFDVFERNFQLSDIIDLKFGVTVLVEANTLQTGIYGLLGAHHFGLSPAGLTAWIIQPRCGHAGGPVRSHRYDGKALRALAATVRAAAIATQAVDAPRHAGAWCRFCPAAASCTERRATQRPRELSLWSPP
jgi:hypothetical protein